MFKHKLRYVFILLLAVYSYLNIYFTVGDSIFNIQIEDYLVFTTILIITLLAWECNRFLAGLIRHTAKRKVHPLILQFVYSTLFLILLSFILQFGLSVYVIEITASDFSHFKLLFAFGFRINLFLTTINALIHFKDQAQQNALNAEKFKKEGIESQYQVLKNQINPHFLFNSFNTLSELTHENKKANIFVQQLSNVYRHVLENQDEELILLSEELEFLDAYIQLLEIRFEDGIKIRKNIPEDALNKYVLTSSSQLLIENAVKHNQVSKSKPLEISISATPDTLIISNTLQQKSNEKTKTGIGIKNIKKRYEFITEQEVKITNNNSLFEVRLPLLHLNE